ncbi:MAG TPA: hypothetical protein VEJ16_01860 [Alphaproteobacteria bacterium]|nr:hypothetical protein [Alphaproteobacteria bacterium]
MAFMMRICALTERNSGGGNPYRYMVGRINDEMRVILMPDRTGVAGAEPRWVLYFAPSAHGVAGAEAEAPFDENSSPAL